MKRKYYIRISQVDSERFEDHLKEYDIEYEFINFSFAFNKTYLYSTTLTTEEELDLRLSFSLCGCLNIPRLLNEFVLTQNE